VVPTDVTNAPSLTEALFKLDPCEWRGRHDEWLTLAMSCKAAGITCRDFVRWSTSDPHYARDEREIERKWHSFEGKHGGALYKALAEHGIKVGAKGKAKPTLYAEVSHGAQAGLPDLRDQSRGLIRWLNSNPREDRLFYVACIFAERGMLQPVAQDILRSNCEPLRKSLGADEFSRTITNAYSHIERKTA
jgi:Primase C terminal 2 (PriCT-2)